MTVAAVILFAHGPEGALLDAAGRAAVRREVESAWAGGATPVVVVCADPEGAVAAALAGSAAILAEPAPVEHGPVAQIVRGMEVARSHISDTDAALIWPGRMAWVDAETVTTLIEAHGAQPDAILRPRFGEAEEPGWPVALPLTLGPLLAAQPVTSMPEELLDGLTSAGARLGHVDTGDPGTVVDITTPLDALPPYEGPPEPVGRPAPEWGPAAADVADDSPLEGPALAPYGQAAEETRD